MNRMLSVVKRTDGEKRKAEERRCPNYFIRFAQERGSKLHRHAVQCGLKLIGVVVVAPEQFGGESARVLDLSL